MALEINGYSSGYPVQQPGDYGRNAMMSSMSLHPTQAVQADLRYTAPDNFTHNNTPAIRADLHAAADKGFATLLSQLGANAFRAMTLQDLTYLFKGNQQAAQKYMKAVDVADLSGNLRPDGLFDFRENRAFMAFQDAPHKIWVDAMQPLGTSQNDSQGANAQFVADNVRRQFCTQIGGNPVEACDGVLTANERAMADVAIGSSPFVTSMILQGLYQKVN